MRWIPLICVLAALWSCGPAHAAAEPPPLRKRDRADAGSQALAIRKEHFAEDVCSIIEKEADRRKLPAQFFARLIWRESLFDPGAVSPVGAEGIAQFMPYTARERGLVDPFSPEEALPASAHLLADHRSQFGNLGLAAAAYNAGQQAVADWLAGGRLSLPYETQDYVAFITGKSVDDWKEATAEFEIEPLAREGAFHPACVKLVKRQSAPPMSSGAKIALAPRKPWGVVLAGGFSEARALKAFSVIKGRYKALLDGKKPMVVRKRSAMGRRKMVSVAVGYDTRQAAEDLCGKLQGLGAACMVIGTD